MTIDSSGIRTNFHFDLSARFSRSLLTQTDFAANRQTSNLAYESSVNYTQASSLKVLETSLSQNFSKRIDNTNLQKFGSPVKTIVNNVLSSVREELIEARKNGANEQQLQTILRQANEGIQKGFTEAREALQGRLESDPRLERQLDRAFNRIQRGLERLDNRFAPNVDTPQPAAIVDSDQNLNNLSKPTNTINDSDATGTANSTAIDGNRENKVIELSKIRSVERSRSFELNIQTQEGDTITLNIEKSLSKQVSKQATLSESGFSLNIEKQVQRDKQITYQVSGDINQQEQAAIDALINKIERLTNKFYQGNYTAAFQKATRIGIDSEQLASFSLNLQSSKSVEVTKTYSEVQGIPATTSPVETLGEFVGEIAQVSNDEAITNVISDPVPVATELFKQITLRDERYAQLTFEQSVVDIDDAIEGVANLAEQHLEEAD